LDDTPEREREDTAMRKGDRKTTTHLSERGGKRERMIRVERGIKRKREWVERREREREREREILASCASMY
jgi:hypothetical protein